MRKNLFIRAAVVMALHGALLACTMPSHAAPVKRTNVQSPTFYVADSDVAHFMDYTGYCYSDETKTEGERFFEAGIGPKALEMIEAAEEVIIMSVFLFDSFYANQPVERDVVGRLTDAFIEKKQANPDMRVAIILDPSHKAYGRRVSPAAKRLREHGIDIFYSDLIGGLKKASLIGIRESMGHANRLVDGLTFKSWSKLLAGISSKARLPAEFDNEQVSLETAYNAALLKANHRKILVTDVHGEDFEALVTTANPHNASAYHVNSALTVRGEPAKYIYNVLRKDMMKSAKLGTLYTHWHDDDDKKYKKYFFEREFPQLDVETMFSTKTTSERNVGVTFVTESKIRNAVIDMLDRVEPGDEVRIQMFYLSFKPVLKAILEAARRTDVPIRLLLDANKDSFNKVKDGTPNRQVARYLLKESKGRLDVRWYSTHGEQNHVKTMSITNPTTGKDELTTGSCNWTGRNMNGVNMEANVVVQNSGKVNTHFNELFDLFWSNSDGNEYSLDYEAFQDAEADWKWTKGEKPFYWSTF